MHAFLLIYFEALLGVKSWLWVLAFMNWLVCYGFLQLCVCRTIVRWAKRKWRSSAYLSTLISLLQYWFKRKRITIENTTYIFFRVLTIIFEECPAPVSIFRAELVKTSCIRYVITCKIFRKCQTFLFTLKAVPDYSVSRAC